MAMLMIDDEAKAAIAKVIAYAEAHPIAFETLRAGHVTDRDVLQLKDRKPGFERPESASVIIPVGYRAAFSIEDQPCGLCRHLSVSVERKGMMPSIPAVELIAEAFGMTHFDSRWLEEFEPGQHAVNVVECYKPRHEGHA
jgi:hypothetical protein